MAPCGPVPVSRHVQGCQVCAHRARNPLGTQVPETCSPPGTRPSCSWVPCSYSQARLGVHSVSSTFEILEAQMVHFSGLRRTRVSGNKVSTGQGKRSQRSEWEVRRCFQLIDCPVHSERSKSRAGVSTKQDRGDTSSWKDSAARRRVWAGQHSAGALCAAELAGCLVARAEQRRLNPVSGRAWLLWEPCTGFCGSHVLCGGRPRAPGHALEVGGAVCQLPAWSVFELSAGPSGS